MELFDYFRNNALCCLSCCILLADNGALSCVTFQQHSVTALVKLASQQTYFSSAYLVFKSSAHSLIAGKCLCRVRDMMTTNDGSSKC